LPPEVLVVRAGALGDVLLLRRAVAALRRDGRRVLLIAPAAAGAALVGPGASEVDEIVEWDRPEVAALFGDGVGTATGLAGRLRGVDLALVYSRNADLARGLSVLVPQVIAHDPAPPAGRHASQWLARPLAAIGLDASADPEPMRATQAEDAAAARLLADLPDAFVAVHPGSGSPRKTWGAERFEALLDALAPRGPWLLVEGPADGEAAARLARRPGAVAARGLDARTLGAVLARAGLFVGHDSGVSHLAAAWGAPTVALFGPTDPAVWAPVGPRVAVVRAPQGRLEALAVDAVAATSSSLRR
jgi:heptosyltransferase-2